MKISLKYEFIENDICGNYRVGEQFETTRPFESLEEAKQYMLTHNKKKNTSYKYLGFA